MNPEILALVPLWVQQNPQLANEWVAAFIDAGGVGNIGSATIAATTTLRQSDNYQAIFPSMYDEGGVPIFTGAAPEEQYFTTLESYRQQVRATGLNEGLFEARYHEMIGGRVTSDEFTQRMVALRQRVLEGGDFIRDYYAENFAFDMTDHGMLASLMDPDLEFDILNRNISMAEIGGFAGVRGFDITTDFASQVASQMSQFGQVNALQAQQFFANAATMVPTLTTLAQRHADPDDTFDLTEFAAAEVFDDPEQRKRIRRLVAQESSTFTGGAQLDLTRAQSGGVTGLSQR